ncbi:hypothetical protein NXS15_01465 [Mycoplasma sp. CSL7475-4]|uniref:hypothetical protein n=1 Tax=Mycoplasma sp. CSL7475-4 TaxID=2973942 RepID=UPI00216AFF04|nr:hypothetical protein [Mycoplasma sp. CSL7475-4]MCS4536792.1 hypothetical protein [Mycoplasma sp. CSL7475-4]
MNYNKLLKSKFSKFWIIGATLGILVPFAIFDLVSRWKSFDLYQASVVITAITIISILALVSIVFLIARAIITLRKSKLEKQLYFLKLNQNPDQDKIKEIETKLNSIINKHYQNR